MSKQEITIIPTREVALPSSIPMPVFDEHLDTYLTRAISFHCDNAEAFEAAKLLRGDGTKLRADILAAFAEPKRLIDSLKQPFLDAENTYLAKLKPAIAAIDATAIIWKTAQDRIAQAKAELARQEEIKRREAAREIEVARLEAERDRRMAALEAEKLQHLALAGEWGEDADEMPVELPPVIVPEVVEPRRVTIESEFKSARGVRNKPKLVVRVTDPDAVGRAYCSPDPIRYTATVKAALAVMQEPTPEQIKALESKIGGIEITFE